MAYLLINYVPWDTSVLSDFASTIRNTVGVTVNKGVIIMGIIVAVLVCLKIAKKFVK